VTQDVASSTMVWIACGFPANTHKPSLNSIQKIVRRLSRLKASSVAVRLRECPLLVSKAGCECIHVEGGCGSVALVDPRLQDAPGLLMPLLSPILFRIAPWVFAATLRALT